MQQIPVTIFTGFLGAGKTTLLNVMMKKKGDGNIIVIINEFGETGIDHELVLVSEDEQIYQMNNGCMCCVLRDDLVQMFVAILMAHEEGKIAVDRILIETSGLAEPSPIAQAIIRTPVLSEKLAVDSILTLVDVENGLHQLRTYNESVEQVAFADRIFLTKLNPDNSLKARLVEETVRAINPFVRIEKLDIDSVQFSDVIGLDLFDRSLSSVAAVEGDLDDMLAREEESHHHHHHGDEDEHGHHHHSDIDAFSIVIDEAIDSLKLESWLNIIIMQYGMDLLRYKGVLNLRGQERQVVLQGINMAFRTDIGKPWEGERQSKILIIGKKIPETIIRKLLNDILS